MARLKRAANDPAVLREAAAKPRRVAVAAADPDSATADPNSATADPDSATADPDSATAGPDSPATNPDCATADLDLGAVDQSPVNSVLSRPSTPISDAFDVDSNYTEFHGPRFIYIEAADGQLEGTTASRSASSASSTIDLVDEDEPAPLSEFRARHIVHVTEQRARRRRNPPPCNRTTYTCRPCARSFTSQRQLAFHQASGRHARALNRLHDLSARLHCQLCNLPFADRHNFELHKRSRIRFQNARRQRQARFN